MKDILLAPIYFTVGFTAFIVSKRFRSIILDKIEREIQ